SCTTPAGPGASARTSVATTSCPSVARPGTSDEPRKPRAPVTRTFIGRLPGARPTRPWSTSSGRPRRHGLAGACPVPGAPPHYVRAGHPGDHVPDAPPGGDQRHPAESVEEAEDQEQTQPGVAAADLDGGGLDRCLREACRPPDDVA